MKKLKLLGILLAAALAHGCGEKGDAEGGTDFRVNSLSNDTHDFNTTCFDDASMLNLVQSQGIEVELESKPTNEDYPIDVIVDSYDLTYIPLDGGPELAGHTYPIADSQIVAGGGKQAFTVEFLPVNTKREYMNATTGTSNYRKISLYQAHYVFYGTTEYNVAVKAEGDQTFWLGNTYVVKCEAQ